MARAEASGSGCAERLAQVMAKATTTVAFPKKKVPVAAPRSLAPPTSLMP